MERTERMKLSDADVRTRIQTDLDSTFVVDAAAGTGKTHELVQRLSTAVETGRAKMENIAALTFTERAAGELKLRVRAELRKRFAGTPTTNEHLARALDDIERASIHTIHGFCAALLREFSVDAQIDPAFRVLAEHESVHLQREVFDQEMVHLLSDPPEGVRALLVRHSVGAAGRGTLREILRDAFSQLVAHRDFDALWMAEASHDLRANSGFATQDALVSEIARLGNLANSASRPGDYLARNLSELASFSQAAALEETPLNRDRMEARLRRLLRSAHWRWKGFGDDYSESLARGPIVSARDRLHIDLRKHVELGDASLAAMLQRELWPAVHRYEQRKAREGVLDYLDLLIRARDLLQRSSSVRDELQTRFAFLFVDEFQDTDPLQAEIVLLLGAEGSATSWRDTRMVPGKLFLVGDANQSIYRFRRADVSFYRDVRAHLVAQGATALRLHTSFRAGPRIQTLINQTFAEVMGDDYVELGAHRDDPPAHPSVVALPIPRPYADFGKVTPGAVTASAPEGVAGFVHFLLLESGWMVDGSPLRAEHICLLFRRLSAWGKDIAQPYAEALEARGVPHSRGKVGEREEIVALSATLRAIEWPDQELDVYAALRGPFLALQDDQLLAFRHHGGRLHPCSRLRPERPTNADLEVMQALDLLRDLHRQRNYRSVADTIAQFLYATRALSVMALWTDGHAAVHGIEQVVSRARMFDAEGGAFRDFVLRYSDADRDRTSLELHSEGVRMLTVHAAKGLEFPIVVLCDPAAPRVRERPSQYVDADKRLWAYPLAGHMPYELLTHRDSVCEADQAEEIRIGYVAATRARDLLVVPAVSDEPLPGWLDIFHSSLYPTGDTSSRQETVPITRGISGCPDMGEDGVLMRPERAKNPARTVRPGLYRRLLQGRGVVWWDPVLFSYPHRLQRGIRGAEWITEDDEGIRARESLADYEAWRDTRERTLKTASVPSTPRTDDDSEVDTASVLVLAGASQVVVPEPRARAWLRPLLRDIPLDADDALARAMVETRGRVLGANPDEMREISERMIHVVNHVLFRRAAASSRCERGLSVAMDDRGVRRGTTLDLLFAEEERWIAVNYRFSSHVPEDSERKQLVQCVEALRLVKSRFECVLWTV